MPSITTVQRITAFDTSRRSEGIALTSMRQPSASLSSNTVGYSKAVRSW